MVDWDIAPVSPDYSRENSVRTKITDLEKLQMRNRFLENSIKHIYGNLVVRNKESIDETIEFIESNFMIKTNKSNLIDMSGK